MRHLRSVLLVLLPVVSAAALQAQQFVVANRGSGSITVFDADGTVDQTVPLPGLAEAPEPMYVVHVRDEVVVGDRANDRLVRFDDSSFAVLGTVDVGEGVFHMWSNGEQLWVNNDIDDTTSVVDTRSWTVAATVPTPADLVAQGYRPHDVFVGDRSAWISLIGGSGTTDWVVEFDNRRFVERRRAPVGKDPHLWLDETSHSLFVASQNADSVSVLSSANLREKGSIAVDGAHGIFLPRGTRTLLVTDITSAGTDALRAHLVLPFRGGSLFATDSVDTPAPTTHNIAASSLGSTVFVTHSGGTSTTVSIYRLTGVFRQDLEFVGTTNAGLNPFGLAVVE